MSGGGPGETVRVKVFCDQCGRLLCRMVDTPRGVAYALNVGSRGAPLTFDARTVFCPEHGVPDLHAGVVAGVAAQLARARGDGAVHTFRAHVSRTWTRRD